jgi:hypothetical protein
MFTLLSAPRSPPRHPRMYFAVNNRSAIMRPASGSSEQGKGTLVGLEHAPPANYARRKYGKYNLR